ncbi:hemoglobin/transferrin/lactoferrin receptor protein [Cnuella takakiae]|uniref:Hemoglobin/transferrin/lactoferrin receptor protein n=2 Tax=Cnuella takakiae TaxID=1302690 RepID=A0A1M5FK72_9BACT|nr:hemoglobin/transferrin/lactoferrin receptor protein [Cnuella takakiae]
MLPLVQCSLYFIVSIYMKYIAGLCLALGLLQDTYAQNDTTRNMDEVVLYSNKFAERKKYIVQKVDLITAQRIAEVNAPTMAELLQNSGQVFVQKSQMGGGSPVLRGFEASRILLVVDGIRMNNAIYRAGHHQYLITVDQNMLDRVEVLYGPASTLYGSDALGGAVLMRTRQPQLSVSGKTSFNANTLIRYGSAANERTVHTDFNVGGRKWAWLQSYTVSDFGDLRMGDHYPDKYPNFGRRSQYITRIGGIDSIVKNSDDRIQRNSAYRQWDLMQKLLFRPSERVNHTLNLQWSSSTDIPRYDRLQDVRNGALRWAQWYYGPQERGLAAYELNVAKLGFFDNLRLNASYQHIEESRHQRAYRSNNLDNRLEEVNVGNFTLDGKKFWQQHELTLGLDAQLNGVNSKANRTDIATGVRTKLDARYPDGQNTMNYYGAYAQHLWKLGGGKWVINDGLRLQAVSLRSQINDNSFFNLPFNSIEQDNLALTGNIGAAYTPRAGSRITASLASGFRSPNVDDLVRIFESGNNQLIVPNKDIDPEYTYTADLGFAQQLGSAVKIEANGFYTWFRNAIALAPFSLNGQSQVQYNGALVPVFANQNVNKAYLYGAQASVTADFTQALSFFSTLTYTYGRLQQPGKSETPLDHIPPVYGRTSIRYAAAKWKAEAFALYNGWKKIRDYNSSGEDNQQYATPEGMPSWYTLNLNASWSPVSFVTLQAGVENILDRNYRVFASGFSAPGRNVVVSVRVKI